MEKTCNDLLLSSLTSFYNNHPDYKYLLQDIINGNHRLSLRLIDWFVTHYSKSHNTCYWVGKDSYHIEMPLVNQDDEVSKRISLYMDYRDQLKSYTKINFDSFRRHSRITYMIDLEKETAIDTTVGQLNFFRWVFKNKIVEYIQDNYEVIYTDMIEKNSKLKGNKEKQKEKTTQGITRTLCTLRFD